MLWLPIVVLPHIVVPSALMYLIYLDHQETITRHRATCCGTRPKSNSPTPDSPQQTSLVTEQPRPTIHITKDTLTEEDLLPKPASQSISAELLQQGRSNLRPLEKEECSVSELEQTCVQKFQERKARKDRYNTSPMHMFAICNGYTLESAGRKLYLKAMTRSPMSNMTRGADFYYQLFCGKFNYENNSIHYSPRLPLMQQAEIKTRGLESRKQFRKRQVQMKYSPMHNYMRQADLTRNSLHRVHHLTGPSSYNCHSPMRHMLLDTNAKDLLAERAIMKSYKRFTHKPKKTPMRDLVNTLQFRQELRQAYRDNMMRDSNKTYFNWRVIPRIHDHRDFVMSPTRKCINKHILYSQILSWQRMDKQHQMANSPMRKLSADPHVQEVLCDSSFIRDYIYGLQERSPMKQYIAEHGNFLRSCARRFLLIHTMARSSMVRCAWTHSGDFWYQANLRELRNENQETSVMRAIKEDDIKQAVTDRAWRLANQNAVRKRLHEDLARNYNTLYRKVLIRNYRKENNIPNPTLVPGYTTAAILFPRNQMKNNQFLADSSLEDFEPKEEYYTPVEFRSYCVTNLQDPANVGDLVDVAKTFKQISHLTDEDTEVHILTDSTKIQFTENDEDMATCQATAAFMRRDQSKFTSSLFNKCQSKIRDYVKRYNNNAEPDAQLEARISFNKKWLDKELVVTLTCPYKDNNMRNVLSDVVQHVNMVKGVIFAKSTDQVRWITI